MMADAENIELALTPGGMLVAHAGAGVAGWSRSLAERFAEGESPGLMALAAGTAPADASLSVVFWREVAAAFLKAVCHVSPDARVVSPADIEPPAPAALAEWVLRAPPPIGPS